MPHHIFTYGSLMFAPVWQRVVRGRCRFAAATLHGYARYAVVGESYPGLVAQAEASVDGILYFDVRADDVAALDLFEGPDYRRESVSVCLPTDKKINAHTYIYSNTEALVHAPWRPEQFDLQGFLYKYCKNECH
jgi:gamma-glutamylcyclotransferase (GGCT)/AIG2-like uncharacterized protein YtfP